MALPRMFKTSRKGQALLELAIFGSLILMVLGALINYGLSEDFNQQITMEAFRDALASAAQSSAPGQPTSTSHLLVADRHIPNPSHPFAAGAVMPVSSGAGVTRNSSLQVTADTPSELPTSIVKIGGQEFRFTEAGLRTEGFVTGIMWDKERKKWVNDPDAVGAIDRYEEIYGSTNVEVTGANAILIVDSCDGQIINYDACVRVAKQLNNFSFCNQECEEGKAPDSTKSCFSICSQPIAVPWYAQGCVGKDNCPPLDAVFAEAANMGLQPGYVKQSDISYTMRKTRVDSAASTGQWVETTTRQIRTRDGVSPVETVKTVPAPNDANW